MNYKPSTLRKIFTSIIFTLFLSNQVYAQIDAGKFINISAGLGLTAPFDESDITGSGFYTQGEYVFNVSKWFGIRPYVGFIFSESSNLDHGGQFEYNVSSKAFLFGGKVRVSAPIPYVAPYFEIGVGASAGSFETYTPFTYIKESGVLAHIPLTFGLALGRKHNFDFALTYYFQPSVEQFCGAVAFGYSFPLN